METNMDKSWINLPRLDPRYLQGVIDFMEFACKNILDRQTEIACPCKNCHNLARKNIDLVKEHLVVNGFTPSYTVWIFHGEKSQPTNCGVENSGCGNFNGQDEMQEMVRDAFGIPPIQAHDIDLDPPLGDGNNLDPPLGDGHTLDEETTKFFKLLKEAERELYPGCQKFSLLSFLVALMHIKCLCGWSNKSFTKLLKLLKKALPEGNTVNFLNNVIVGFEIGNLNAFTMKRFPFGFEPTSTSYNLRGPKKYQMRLQFWRWVLVTQQLDLVAISSMGLDITPKSIDNNRGLVPNDEFGFTLANFNCLLYTTEHASNEPFILASQAQQVFYVQDPAKEDWSIVIKMKPRDLFEICEVGDGHVADIEVDGIYQQEEDDTTLHDEDNEWIRDDLPGLTLNDEDNEYNSNRKIAMSRRRATTLEDPVEHGRMREPPRTWYPIGSNLNSSSQGETRSLSDGSSLEVGNSSTQTRGRGPSLMNASWSTGNNPIKIVLNDRGQPVMPEASSLATNLGVLARDGSLLPLHYTDWRYVPAHYKKRVWEEIKAHTDANDSLERWFMQSLGRKWQGWKCDAKKQGYTPYNNDADRIAHRPSRVTEEQWRCLVYYWNDRDVKDKDDGKNPTRIDTFIKTHTRKGGGEVNEETSAIVNKLKALRCQDGSSSHPMSEGAIFSQAIGPERPGRTRGLGLGATKSKMLGAKNNDQAPSQSSTERDREFMKMKSKVQKMKRFLEAMGYTDDTDDDSDEFNVAPNENHPDASSAHREMTIGNNQASPEEINLAHRSQPEPTPFPRPNQQADSHHQCEPGSTAAADLAMWKQAGASRDARKLSWLWVITRIALFQGELPSLATCQRYYACALLLLCCIAALLAEFEVLFWKNPPMQGPFRRFLVV
ncbi:hypothetical protein RHGRI_013710 [Rhododendron griersonianum]|uniref:Transposase-associated domain-containing protein n=1 Tax=Rhododendron griersonianum TaxID=479676 RepID=A0AAV6K6V9_9ERIC|nr:hypothetical protein RHGRI_013710 [Rhododendron griersonianum]